MNKKHKEVKGCATLTLFNKVELWWRKDSWYLPDEYVFGIERNCYNKCVIVEMGFVGITWLCGECKK